MPQLSGKRPFIKLLKEGVLTSFFGNPIRTEFSLVDAFVVGEAFAPVLR